jgi:perosamine synthetase
LLQDGSVNAFYVQPVKYNQAVLGVHRNVFVNAIKAEIPAAILRETAPLISAGYVRPLYLQPIYQQKQGKCSFNCPHYSGETNYNKGICPITEEMHFNILITHEYMRPGMTEGDMDDVVNAFDKVISNIHELHN